jgi:integrase
MPPRIDTKLMFPAPRGGYIDIEKFRYREWAPALRAAGVDHRRIYDCRHTFASWALDGVETVDLLKLSRFMGTSIAEIERSYAHLMPDAEDQMRGLLDGYDDAFDAAKRDRSKRSLTEHCQASAGFTRNPC